MARCCCRRSFLCLFPLFALFLRVLSQRIMQQQQQTTATSAATLEHCLIGSPLWVMRWGRGGGNGMGWEWKWNWGWGVESEEGRRLQLATMLISSKCNVSCNLPLVLSLFRCSCHLSFTLPQSLSIDAMRSCSLKCSSMTADCYSIFHTADWWLLSISKSNLFTIVTTLTFTWAHEKNKTHRLKVEFLLLVFPSITYIFYSIKREFLNRKLPTYFPLPLSITQ